MPKDPKFEIDKAFLLEMYDGWEPSEHELRRAIKEHREFIDLYFECEEDE